jgi:hypothetical protein
LSTTHFTMNGLLLNQKLNGRDWHLTAWGITQAFRLLHWGCDNQIMET